MEHFIDIYLQELYLREEYGYLSEIDIKRAFDRITSKGQLNQIINKLKKVRGEKPEEIAKVITKSRIPVIRYRKLDNYFSDKFENYTDNRDKAFLVLRNSLTGADKKLLWVAASFLSIKSLVKRKNSPISKQDKVLKNSLKDFVSEVRETADEQNNNDDVQRQNNLDYAVGAVLISTGLLVVLAMAKGFMIVSSALEPIAVIVGVILLLALIAASISWATGAAAVAQ